MICLGIASYRDDIEGHFSTPPLEDIEDHSPSPQLFRRRVIWPKGRRRFVRELPRISALIQS
jgi:hypothetical protein